MNKQRESIFAWLGKHIVLSIALWIVLLALLKLWVLIPFFACVIGVSIMRLNDNLKSKIVWKESKTSRNTSVVIDGFLSTLVITIPIALMIEMRK